MRDECEGLPRIFWIRSFSLLAGVAGTRFRAQLGETDKLIGKRTQHQPE